MALGVSLETPDFPEAPGGGLEPLVVVGGAAFTAPHSVRLSPTHRIAELHPAAAFLPWNHLQRLGRRPPRASVSGGGGRSPIGQSLEGSHLSGLSTGGRDPLG